MNQISFRKVKDSPWREVLRGGVPVGKVRSYYMPGLGGRSTRWMSMDLNGVVTSKHASTRTDAVSALLDSLPVTGQHVAVTSVLRRRKLIADAQAAEAARRQAEAAEPDRRCTCGAVELTACLCGISPREFYATK